jgi:carboxypeptidase C (cathepsin A)
MHEFLKILFLSFPKLEKLDLYIGGESYGGTWVLVLAARIHEYQHLPMASTSNPTPSDAAIKLKGIILGNVQVAQQDQWKSFYDTDCTGSRQNHHLPQPQFIQYRRQQCGKVQGAMSRQGLGALVILFALLSLAVAGDF